MLWLLIYFPLHGPYSLAKIILTLSSLPDFMSSESEPQTYFPDRYLENEEKYLGEKF